jgi:hypothetical protein
MVAPDVPVMPQLYRHYDANGRLLYVGISRLALRRLEQHSESPWFHSIARVTIKHFDTWKAVRAAETAAIATEWPQHNVAQHPHRRAEARRRRQQAEVNRVLAEAAEAEETIRDLRARLDASEARVDRLLLTDQRRSWWRRLRGR